MADLPIQQNQTSKFKWLAMLGIGMGVLMATLDSSIVNISLPTLMEVFGAKFSTVQWVILAYSLIITSLMLGAARLGDMVDKKKLYLGGLATFTLGSLLCALAPNINWLIGFRAIQGLGATFTQALGVAIITEVFPAKERGKALGIIGSVVSTGIALGPPLGGLIIGSIGWHWIFLVNIPIGIIALWIVQRFVPHSFSTRPNQKFDLAGALILFATLICYAGGMTAGQNIGFSASLTQILLGSALAGLLIFLWVENRIDQPMIDFSLFRNVLFGINLLMAFLVFIVMGGFFILPFYLELVQGYPAQMVGFLLMANPIAMGLVAPLAGSLSDRFGSRGISLIGLISIVIGALALSTLRAGLSPLGFIIRFLPIGLGLGMFQSPNNSAIMGSAPRERLGIASGLMTLSRTLGQTSGIPLTGALFTAQVLAFAGLPAGTDMAQAGSTALVTGIQGTFQIAAGFILASTALAITALWIDTRRKKNSPQQESVQAND